MTQTLINVPGDADGVTPGPEAALDESVVDALDLDGIERVLAVTAHPDDVDFGSAGTIARLVKAGVAVSYCICTDGDAGGFDPAVPREEIPAIRRAEQTAAAAALGVADVVFLGYPDGALEANQDLRRDISRQIRRVRPNRMIIMSPERNWARLPASHPDHMAAGEAAIRAIYPDARNPFAHPGLMADGLEAWTVHSVWVQGHPRPDRFIDITDTFADKVAALRCHKSQTEHMTELESMLRSWLTAAAASGGLPEGRLAEAYFTVSIG